ncbi:MAG: hypothetical protein ICV59_01050 [Thermoleophilia bacterium]|nr:hypothetical protein [Thermoleophilia bacterium]
MAALLLSAVVARRRGTVTFVFTDIEGSTRLVHELGERYGEVQSTHRRLIRTAFAAHGGDEVDTQGDSFLYVFGRARDAALATADAQRALAACEWPDGVQLRVRMGMHTGEPGVSEEGYHGVGVHRAARVMAAAHGGQVLASQASAAVLGDERLPGIELRDLGQHELKDLDRPERIFQLDIDGLPTGFPPLRTQTAAVARPFYRRPLLVGAAAGVVAAAVAIPVFAIAGGSGGGQTLDAVQDNAVAAIDASSGDIVDEAPDIPSPERVAAGANAVWVTSSKGGGSVIRLDPESHDVEDTIEVGSGPQGIAYGAGAVWVANSLDGTVSRISPETNEVVETYSVGNTPSAIAVGHDSVWVTNADDRTVSRVDATTGDARTTIPVDAAARGLAIGGGAVWLTDPVGNAVVRLDPASQTVVGRINVGSGPTAIVYGEGRVWVANNLDGTVTRIDVARGTVTGTYPVGVAPNGIAVARDAVWVTDEVTGALVRVDPETGEAVRTRLGGRPEGVSAVEDSIWVAVQAAGDAHRGGTLKIAWRKGDFVSIDPARAYGPLPWQLLAATSDGLVGFKKVGGADGNTLVPDLAITLPAPTDGGRTYRFQLREGVRFSTGREVKPSDIRYTLERMFRAPPDGRPDFYAGIVGGDACLKHPRRCDLGSGVVADDKAGTVTFHLREPDPEFLYKLAMPFAFALPAGTPVKGDRPVPGTGPYRIAEYRKERRIRLVRNEHFRVWSRAAQPDGLPDAIEVSVIPSAARQAEGVIAGRLDVTSDVARAKIEEARTRHASQLHVTPAALTIAILLNTRRAPFDDVRARRAVAYALDRSRIVEDLGGSEFAAPTCQLLPPNFPAYRSHCRYTTGAGDSWTAPDRVRARRLARESGTTGATVNVLVLAQGYQPLVSTSRALVGALRQLGYGVRVHRRSDPEGYFGEFYSGGARYDAATTAWAQDYPAPGNFLEGIVGCVQNPYSCDRAIDRRIRADRALQARDPQAAVNAWAALDRELARRAGAIGAINLRAMDFVSRRVGNYQHHPVFGMLLSQVWVR